MAIIGIDLGTTNSLAVCWKNGKTIAIKNSLGDTYTPSAVSVDDNNDIIVGKVASERLISHPERSVSEFKRNMGTDYQFSLGDRKFSAVELSSFVLKKIKKDAEAFLGESVEEAIISVPAYFDDNSRNATKMAAKLSGLNVNRLINEPSAAALAYAVENNYSEGTYMIIDFGGGTLDVSIVDTFDSIIEILAVSGDNSLGGKDFNEAIVKYFCKINGLCYDDMSDDSKAIIYRNAENCKIALSSVPSAMIIANINQKQYSAVIDNNKLINIASDIFDRISIPVKKALHDSKCTIDDIDDIILVGGSCKMPVIRSYIEMLLHKKPYTGTDPDTAIAIGAGIFAGIKQRNEKLKDVIITDICPFSLGISTYNIETNEDLMEFIIDRNTSLPASRMKKFCAISDGQKKIKIRIYQGESMLPAKNLFLGEFEVECPETKKNDTICEVRLTYDINGILMIDVTTVSDNQNHSKIIISKTNQMSESELDVYKSKMEEIKLSKENDEENALLIARAQRMYEEALPEERDIILRALIVFKSALQKQKNHEIRICYEQLNEILDNIGGQF